MSEFKIESDVPMPSQYGPTSPFREALRALKVGQSFDVGTGQKLANMRTVSAHVGDSTARKFSWRKTRVWRIA